MRVTSTQPEPVKQRIYGSTPVEPLGGASNQPQVLPHTKVYGQRKIARVRVKLKDRDDGRELVIDEKDFDPARHERLAQQDQAVNDKGRDRPRKNRPIRNP